MLLGKYQITLTGEFLVRFNTDIDVEVAFWPVGHGLAVLTQTDYGTVVDTGWDLECDILTFLLCPFAVTDRTDFFGDFARTFTCWTGASLLDVAENGSGAVDDLSRAFTGIAGLQLIAWLHGRTFAVLTAISQCDRQCFFGSEDCFFKAEIDVCFHVAAACLSLALSAAITAEETAEYITEAEVSEIKVDILPLPAETGERIAIAGCTTADAGMTELVVALALLLILQDFIGFVDFLELLFIAATVWMNSIAALR